ncbi:MAG: RDD family protein [Candidatus Margulisbacteria bacterium]|nr:RDD family protein [Candidatus Margulisiibacteriota bacterium]
MRCPECNTYVDEGHLFCSECQSFVPNPKLGIKASIWDRWLGHILSSMLLFAVLTFVEFYEKSLLMQGIIIFTYIVLVLIFYLQSQTPGKYIMRLRVIHIQSKQKASFKTMLLREIIGKTISGLALSIGYVWAFFDVNQQTWHDKIAGTVIVKELKPIISVNPVIQREI